MSIINTGFELRAPRPLRDIWQVGPGKKYTTKEDIPTGMRYEFLITTDETGKQWRLEGGVENVNWVEYKTGSPDVIWGGITGNIDDQHDLKDKLAAKEEYLGLPAGANYVLISNNLGVRQWLSPDQLGVVSVNGETGTVTLDSSDIPEGTNLYFTDTRADARVQYAINDTVTSSVTLYSSEKIRSLISGSLNYRGAWDASTNTPPLSDATGTENDFYKVSVAGSRDLGHGIIAYKVNDDLIHNGTIWEEFSSVESVSSVNGKVGTVILNTDDISEGSNNLYFTDARVIAQLHNVIDDNVTVSNKTWSSVKIDNRISAQIGAIVFPVISVNGHTGNVVVTKADVALGDVDNTSDADKPISTATQTALNSKADNGHTHTETDITNLDKYTQAEVDAAVNTRTRWLGKWIQRDVSNPYIKNDQALHGSYLGIANKETVDTLAPQSVGSARDVYQGTSPTVTRNGKVIATGISVSNNINAYSIQSYSVYTIKDNHYRVFSKNSGGKITELADFIARIDGWQNIKVSNNIIPSNTDYQVGVNIYEPAVAPVMWDDAWNYTTPRFVGAPATGEIIHADRDINNIHIHKTSDNGTDRASELLALVAGDIIHTSDMDWSISRVTDNSSYVSFAVSPVTQSGSDGVKTFSFETTATTPIVFVEDVDYWLNNPWQADIKGFYGLDGNTIVENNNAYGINLHIQEVYVSPDWDLQTTYNTTIVGDTGTGVDPIQSNWDETDTASLAYILNKPDLSLKEDSLGLGAAGQVLATNAAADGKEWIDMSGGGSDVHNDLTGRDVADAHPIEAVTGLQDSLDSKVGQNTTGTVSIVNSIWVGTQAEYDALGTYDDTVIYNITGTNSATTPTGLEKVDFGVDGIGYRLIGNPSNAPKGVDLSIDRTDAITSADIVAIGYNAGKNMGPGSIAIGKNAMNFDSTGSGIGCIAIGENSLGSGDTGRSIHISTINDNAPSYQITKNDIYIETPGGIIKYLAATREFHFNSATGDGMIKHNGKQLVNNNVEGTSGMVSGIWVGTQSEYDAISHSSNVIYMIK